MMNCQQATRLLSDAQERELPLKDRAALKIHVLMCSGCRHFAQHLDILRVTAHRYAKGKGQKDDARDSAPPEHPDQES